MPIPTPHISAKAGDFAPTVLMPGDPLRAKYIAEHYLENPVLVNNVRGVQGYTGLYNGRPVSVMASGMGIPTVSIYARELFEAYDVDNIIRIGTAGAISEKLGIPLDKIGITYNGWEHMKNVTPDESIFDKMPGVKKGEYFYALGSLAKHKNFKWIREVARRSPDKTFVVAGGKDLRAFGDDAEAKDTHNVFYPGYVSDAENAALMKHCKLFLHPAVFEGFGIPPLEALALGAPVALANATCLPELYGDTARYFDPYDYDVDLDALAAQPVAAPAEVLKKYSWDKTAEFWLHEMEKYAKQ